MFHLQKHRLSKYSVLSPRTQRYNASQRPLGPPPLPEHRLQGFAHLKYASAWKIDTFHEMLTSYLEVDSVVQQADADDAVAYAWVVGPTRQVKRTPEDADDAVAYAWVVGPTSKIRRAAEDADDAVAYAWVVGPSAA